MNRQTTLTTTSLVLIVLSTLHITGDVVHGMEAYRPSLLIGLLVLAVWLYGTVALSRHASGYVIMLLGALLGAVMPVIHLRAGRIGGDFATTGGAFPFVFTLFALAVTSPVAIVLAAQSLWTALRSPQT